MSEMSFPARVATAKTLLEEAAEEHDDLPPEQMVNLQEAIEFLDRLEASFQDGQAHD